MCGESSCPYFTTEGEQTDQSAAPAPVLPAPATVPADVPMDVPAARAVAAPPLSSLAASQPRAVSAPVGAGAAEVTLQGPERRFSCVRLDCRSGGDPRLLGDAYVAKLRLGLASCGASDVAPVLNEAWGHACGQLADRVLIPQSCAGAEIMRARGQVTVNLTDGSHFAVPERECLFLPGVAPDFLAKWLTEVLLGREEFAGTFLSAGVQWLEVCLSTSMGEVSYRIACSG